MGAADSSETVAQQWMALVGLLEDSRSALLYHMENHYCLVFAARSWLMDAGLLLNMSAEPACCCVSMQQCCAPVAAQGAQSPILHRRQHHYFKPIFPRMQIQICMQDGQQLISYTQWQSCTGCHVPWLHAGTHWLHVSIGLLPD